METLEGLLEAWSAAEARGDVTALEALLDPDFLGDGPVGVVVDKRRWLDRHRAGELGVAWICLDVRLVHGAAIATGWLRSGLECRPSTIVAVRSGRGWAIVNVQVGDPGHLADVRRPPARQSAGMTDNDSTPQQVPPGPDPALKALDRWLGTWDMHGRTLDSDVDNVHGRATFEWLPGGYFFQQRIELDFAGMQIESLEVIGYDPATGTFPSTVYSNMAGLPLPYRWEIDGDELTITTEMLGAAFRGRWSEDGATFSGGWRPNPGREGGGNVPYDISGSRASGEE